MEGKGVKMTVEWRFYPQKATDPISNPISGEFFSTEAVGDVAEAIIREGIQNTLDARLNRRSGPCKVRVFLSGDSGSLAAPRVKRWFGSLWPHVMAPRNGLRNQPECTAPCPFLVFEDFETIGLTGDPGEHLVIENVTNHFLNFFRAEGHSDKGEQDRGSWGVGKTVFPRASRVSTYFGLTVRSDDGKHLLLGRSILKYHRVNGQSFKSDGYFGEPRDADGFMLPCDTPAVLAEFRDDFHIARQNESGLSIVVPWYETDGDDGVDRDKVIHAVLRGFFYPILLGQLAVTVATPDEEIVLDAHSIMDKVEALGGSLSMELLPMLQLAEWAQTRLVSEFRSLNAPPPENAQKWSHELVPDSVLLAVRQLLSQRQRVALHVPVHVQLRMGEPQLTHFDIFLEHSEEDSGRPVFIRDDLIIPDVKPPRISQVRALVIVEDKPLAALLRDAETPAHTQWNQDTSHFKNKYKFGPGVIRFVRYGVSELLSIINQAEQDPDPSITVDFFSIPAEPEETETVPARRRRPRQQQGLTPPPPVPPLPPPPPRRFRIERMDGGFSIRSGDTQAPVPPYIEVRVAYDIRSGNPLRNYDFADFDVGKAPVRWDSHDGSVEVLEAEGNRMLLGVKRPGFQLDVVGFDTNRELYVKANAKEAAND